VSETELRFAVFFRDFENNLCVLPLGFVFSEIEIVVQNQLDDFLAGDEFDYFHLATMDVFVVMGELSPEFVGSPSISPDHHPQTLLMALKTSSGVWSTENVVVKF
jgi:hypothetical protein